LQDVNWLQNWQEVPLGSFGASWLDVNLKAALRSRSFARAAREEA
jgi:hypothetical protein